jgi:two-component system invasion response regulator UvrY
MSSSSISPCRGTGSAGAISSGACIPTIRARAFSSSACTAIRSSPRALEAGATGYVLKDTAADELMEAFDKVRTGSPYLSSDLAMQVALLRTGVRPDPLADQTPRELQTLSLLAQGKAYGRIAEELGVSYKTVVNACSQLKQKLNAKNLPDLIRLAVQLVAVEP